MPQANVAVVKVKNWRADTFPTLRHPPAPGRGFSLSTTGGVCVSVRVLFLPGFSPPRSLLQKIVNTLLPGGRGFDNDNNNNNNETDE